MKTHLKHIPRGSTVLVDRGYYSSVLIRRYLLGFLDNNYTIKGIGFSRVFRLHAVCVYLPGRVACLSNDGWLSFCFTESRPMFYKINLLLRLYTLHRLYSTDFVTLFALRAVRSS